ncbi:MAG: methyltransferase [Beijerinckiaceae bacterium]|nr:methyltransferase [Beijerinckiaceae bacterium]
MTSRDATDRARFIAEQTLLLPVPFVPEIRLYMASEATELWQKTEDDLEETGLPPPFWAFAWAGGQALARYVIDNPGLVRGRTVLDFAAGSGLVAIAAAMAGAARVTACEIDAYSIAAMALNGSANGVQIETRFADLVGVDEGWDVVFAGDVSYERDMAARVTDWLASLHARGALVLIGDPGRSYLARERLEPVAEYEVPVVRDLEDADVKTTKVWRFKTS